jgi:hypothetical protein
MAMRTGAGLSKIGLVAGSLTVAVPLPGSPVQDRGRSEARYLDSAAPGKVGK